MQLARSNSVTPAQFLQAMTAQKTKLIIAIDATGSRHQSWETATKVQGNILDDAIAAHSRIELKIGYFRGIGELKFTGWESNPAKIKRPMQAISCEAGKTQITRLFNHTIDAGATSAIFIGDAMEEDKGALLAAAEAQNCQWHMVQDKSHWNHSVDVEPAFRQIAAITGGTYLSYGGRGESEREVAQQLSQSMKALAVLSAAGVDGLIKLDTPAAVALLEQT